ncbi:MAG: DUF5946 family protein [Chloroflexota bacterium]|nr:DUF5946 family protein [Chloroflexota bacterium]
MIDSTMTQARPTCPECGAPIVDGLSCWEQLGLLIAWEFQDPELQAEHFLTVSAYNLQHPAQFTDEALAGLRAMFVEHLDNGLAVPEIRRRVGKASAGNTRVLKDESERRPVLRSWSMTIADVYLPGRPEGAAARVRAWAASIRAELG